MILLSIEFWDLVVDVSCLSHSGICLLFLVHRFRVVVGGVRCTCVGIDSIRFGLFVNVPVARWV